MNTRIKIIQPKLRKRIDSFWYSGDIASLGHYKLITCGEIRCKFPDTNDYTDWYRDNSAVEEALRRKYNDKSLSKVTFDMNNWFEVIWEDETFTEYPEPLESTAGEYDEGITMLKEIAKDKDYFPQGWERDRMYKSRHKDLPLFLNSKYPENLRLLDKLLKGEK
jgi:hypothetical protein